MPKKSLVNDNPFNSTLQFLSNTEDIASNNAQDDNPVKSKEKPIPIQNRIKVDKNRKELKRKRYNLLLIPSLYAEIAKIAYVEKISVNEAINQALELYKKQNKCLLDKFAEIERLRGSKE